MELIRLTIPKVAEQLRALAQVASEDDSFELESMADHLVELGKQEYLRALQDAAKVARSRKNMGEHMANCEAIAQQILKLKP